MNKKGFTLIELLIVVAIIGILIAVAIPGYLGMQERGKKGAITRIAEASIPELQAWMISVRKSGGMQGLLKEVDTDADGIVGDAGDLTNNQLGSSGFGPVSTWITARQIMRQKSPWNATKDLWRNLGPVGSMGACMTAAQVAANNGQICLCTLGADDAFIQAIYIVVVDNNSTAPGVLYNKTVSSD